MLKWIVVLFGFNNVFGCLDWLGWFAIVFIVCYWAESEQSHFLAVLRLVLSSILGVFLISFLYINVFLLWKRTLFRFILNFPFKTFGLQELLIALFVIILCFVLQAGKLKPLDLFTLLNQFITDNGIIWILKSRLFLSAISLLLLLASHFKHICYLLKLTQFTWWLLFGIHGCARLLLRWEL